jgi:hypothetical protein
VLEYRFVRNAARSFIVLAVACAAGAGCFNTGALSNGSSGGDAGADARAVGDATSPAPLDGSSGGDSPDSSAPFCESLSPAPTFCDDFDEGDSGSFATWDQVIQSSLGSVSRSTTFAYSAPYSMLAQTSAVSSGTYAEADVLKEFATFAQQGVSISMSFEMNLQAWDSSTSGQIIAAEVIFKNSSTQFNQIVLNLDSLGTSGVSAQIAENAQGADGGEAGYNSYPLDSHPATQSWTKVEIDLSIPSYQGSTSNTVSVKLDGQTVLASQALSVSIQGGIPWVHLGIGYVATPATPWIVYYDNFVADITPI